MALACAAAPAAPRTCQNVCRSGHAISCCSRWSSSTCAPCCSASAGMPSSQSPGGGGRAAGQQGGRAGPLQGRDRGADGHGGGGGMRARRAPLRSGSWLRPLTCGHPSPAQLLLQRLAVGVPGAGRLHRARPEAHRRHAAGLQHAHPVGQHLQHGGRGRVSAGAASIRGAAPGQPAGLPLPAALAGCPTCGAPGCSCCSPKHDITAATGCRLASPRSAIASPTRADTCAPQPASLRARTHTHTGGVAARSGAGLGRTAAGGAPRWWGLAARARLMCCCATSTMPGDRSMPMIVRLVGRAWWSWTSSWPEPQHGTMMLPGGSSSALLLSSWMHRAIHGWKRGASSLRGKSRAPFGQLSARARWQRSRALLPPSVRPVSQTCCTAARRASTTPPAAACGPSRGVKTSNATIKRPLDARS
jgi:hypothetical protein